METLAIRKWHVIYTRPLKERKIICCLLKKGIKYYQPMNRVKRKCLDRDKSMHIPLLPSYLFIYITTSEHSYINKIKGVVSFVYWLNRPAIITNEEIEEMKIFLQNFENITFDKTPISDNNSTTLKVPLLQKDNDEYLIQLRLPSLGYVLKANLKKEYLETIPKRTPLQQESFVTRFAS